MLPRPMPANYNSHAWHMDTLSAYTFNMLALTGKTLIAQISLCHFTNSILYEL